MFSIASHQDLMAVVAELKVAESLAGRSTFEVPSQRLLALDCHSSLFQVEERNHLHLLVKSSRIASV